MTTRRNFIVCGAALGTAWAGGARCCVTASTSSCDSYSISILGDTHFDAAPTSLYHGKWKPRHQNDWRDRQGEFARNQQMWAERLPRLIAAAAKTRRPDTAYLFQMGDLIQGDTPDSATHVRFLEDAMNLFKADLAPGLPFVTVAGNHDLRGNDDAVATRAYTSYMPARLSRELGQEITGSDFLFRVGPDAFVVIKFTKPDIARIERLIAEAKGSRHIFLVSHSPVFPYDDAKYFWWFLLGNRNDTHAAERRQMRKLLAENEVIVLCGHTHATEFLDWRGDGGRITQMTMSSVWSNDRLGSFNEIAGGAEQYGTLLFKAKPELKTEANQALFAEYREGIQQYSMALSAGSYKLIVDGPNVYVDFYAGSSEELTHRYTLR